MRHRRILFRWILLLVLSGCTTGVSFGAIYYLDPIGGDISNDGSVTQPWPSLEEVIAANLVRTRSYTLPYDAATSTLMHVNANGPIGGGDTLMLRSGLHGSLFVRGAYNMGYITIMNDDGHEPILDRIEIMAGSHWRFVGLTVSSEPYGQYISDNLLYLHTHGFHGPVHDVQIDDCFLYSTLASGNWSADDWLQMARSGIRIDADRVILENSRLLNVNFGISMIGDSISVKGCTVENFSGDGIRTLGRHHLIESNTIKNCYKVNDNHDDAIQSFNLGTYDTRDVVIRGNTIINYEDVNQPLLGPLQGIGCFDGPYHNWTIENNIISVDHWHGISLYGAYGCTIVNNTVIDPTPAMSPGPSWIRINPDKDGTPSENNIVANNLTNSLSMTGTVVVSANILLAEGSLYDIHVKDVSTYDFRLAADSPAVDSGDDLYAPPIDIAGVIRPHGIHTDVGAYEYDGFVSNTDVPEPARLVCYPNPVSDVIVFEHAQGSVAIYDANGHVVMRIDRPSTATEISHLAVGVYAARDASGHTTRFILGRF